MDGLASISLLESSIIVISGPAQRGGNREKSTPDLAYEGTPNGGPLGISIWGLKGLKGGLVGISSSVLPWVSGNL